MRFPYFGLSSRKLTSHGAVAVILHPGKACLVVGRRLLSGSEAFMLHCPHRLILDNPSSSQNLVGIHDIQSFFRITWLFVSMRVLNFS